MWIVISAFEQGKHINSLASSSQISSHYASTIHSHRLMLGATGEVLRTVLDKVYRNRQTLLLLKTKRIFAVVPVVIEFAFRFIQELFCSPFQCRFQDFCSMSLVQLCFISQISVFNQTSFLPFYSSRLSPFSPALLHCNHPKSSQSDIRSE